MRGKLKTMKDYRKIIDKLTGRLDYLSVKIKEREKNIKEAEKNLETVIQVQEIVKKLAVETQGRIKYRIEKIIQLALDTCFPEEYVFSLDYSVVSDKTEYKLTFLKDGCEESIMKESGGGLIDVLSFVFRVALWSLSSTRNVLLLDEPFSALSRDLHEKVGVILQKISKELNIQILMITHNDKMVEFGDKVFKIGSVKEDGYKVSTVEIVNGNEHRH
jgi:DNA repair exonuclease SbcCD ATPase subunit